MRIFLCPFFLIVFQFILTNGFGQTSKAADTVKINVLNQHAYDFWYSDLDSVLLLADKQMRL